MRCRIEAVGFAAAGLADWDAFQAFFAEANRELVAGEATPWQSDLLPANERRRATPAIRQAFQAAEDARRRSRQDFSLLASVFATADGDMNVLHRICSTLAVPPRMVSPTDFHNSVQNAASGYWSIAVRGMLPSTTLAAGDGSFAAGLLEAATLAIDGEQAVLLVAYDVPAPAPLAGARPYARAAGVALVLEPSARLDHATLELELSDAPESACLDPRIEALRVDNPALRALPLLERLASRRSGTVALPLSRGTTLGVMLAP